MALFLGTLRLDNTDDMISCELRGKVPHIFVPNKVFYDLIGLLYK